MSSETQKVGVSFAIIAWLMALVAAVVGNILIVWVIWHFVSKYW